MQWTYLRSSTFFILFRNHWGVWNEKSIFLYQHFLGKLKLERFGWSVKKFADLNPKAGTEILLGQV